MNLAVRTGDYNARPVMDSRVDRVEIFGNLAGAATYWRALEHDENLATAFQRYDFLKFWQIHIGAPAGVTPLIVVGVNAKRAPLFLWPLGRHTAHGGRIAEFLGGKHANFNMGLWRRDVAAKITADELRAVLTQLSNHADVLKLTHQPMTWAGATNPLALLPYQKAANTGFSGALVSNFEDLLRARTNAAARKKMRKKERALADFGAVRFERVSAPAGIRLALDVFFKQKNARMRSIGVADVFSQPGVRRFIEAAATVQTNGNEAPIELYTLSVNDIIVATMGGIVARRRFSAMFNSMAEGHYAVESPGEQLLLRVVRDCCERGLTTFDLGIGESHYKNLFCRDAEPLFDCYLPLTARGRLHATAFKIATACKRSIKQNTAFWSGVRAMRRLRARLSA
jgi:CelD/BcsL family acetyltransferase involved in cellulose biosynthesis